jgi:hypothetical protein
MNLKILDNGWNEDTTRWLSAACDETYPVWALEADFHDGLISVYNVYLSGIQVGSLALRIDNGFYREMVVIAVSGNMGHYSFCGIADIFIQHLARLNHCEMLRAHTSKAGMLRILEALGWTKTETVLRKKVEA